VAGRLRYHHLRAAAKGTVYFSRVAIQGNGMKALGIGLVVVGLLGALLAFNMNVAVDGVNNIGLLNERSNFILFTGLAILIGALLVGFGSVANKSYAEQAPDLRACPYCAELIKREAIVCKHCRRDVPAETTEPEAPDAQSHAQSAPFRELCARLRQQGLTYQQYQQLAQAAGATLGLTSNSIFASYVVTRDGKETVIRKFNDLKPWFLQNVVPNVERKD
jgi:hypothetical protein